MSTADASRARTGVPILMYHQVSARPLPGFQRYTVTPRAFEAQMRWLRAARYQPITLDSLHAAWRGITPLPRRPVVITFDDGFAELAEYAIPTLIRYRFTATLFLVAGLLGRRAEWLWNELGADIPLMSRATVRECAAAGLQCGAHTVSHPRLTSLADAACAQELRDSRMILEDALGTEVVHLAYPFGASDARVHRLARAAGFQLACTTRAAIATRTDDPLALPRVSVYGHDGLTSFVWRLRTAQSPRAWASARLAGSGRRAAGGASD